MRLLTLSEKQILKWADAYYRAITDGPPGRWGRLRAQQRIGERSTRRSRWRAGTSASVLLAETAGRAARDEKSSGPRATKRSEDRGVGPSLLPRRRPLAGRE